jgi:predicted DNA-binding transcriptional regulator YafY
MKLLQQIELIERLDQLIRLKATGNPKNLATKLEVSEATLYRAIEAIKSMGAPVEFSIRYQSYVYSKEVNFMCGFFMKGLTPDETKKVNGGFGLLTYFSVFN